MPLVCTLLLSNRDHFQQCPPKAILLGARQRSGEGVVQRNGCPKGCFWRVRFFSAPLRFSGVLRANLEGAEKKRTLQKHPFGGHLRNDPSFASSARLSFNKLQDSQFHLCSTFTHQQLPTGSPPFLWFQQRGSHSDALLALTLCRLLLHTAHLSACSPQPTPLTSLKAQSR